MKKRIWGVSLCVLCAGLALLYATTSSPLYATNFWTDTNIYFTIGRGMTNGLMPYRDLFDHKGPLLYLIYALGACLSGSSFLGVFMLEWASLSAVLYAGWRLVCLFGEGALTLLSIPVTAMVTVCCRAFTQGGSAEEFILPALVLGLYASVRLMRGDCAHPVRMYAGFGAAMGWVFAIKYTNCGLFAGLGICVLLYTWRVNGFGRAMRAGLTMLLGMLGVLLPITGFLLAQDVLRDCVNVYFVQNLTTYSGEPMRLMAHGLNALAYLRTQSAANPAVALLAAAGCVFAFAHALHHGGKGAVATAVSVPCGAGLLLLLTYWGEMAHPYYALVFAALVPLGLAPLGLLAAQVPDRAACGLALVLTLLVLPAGRLLCAAVPLLAVERAEMPQTIFAQIMNKEENPTLLDLTSLDQGFYLAAGMMPTCRYFADNNLQTQEKKDALAKYLSTRCTQFVVTRWRDALAGYERVCEASGLFDLADERTYQLFKRLDE